MSLAPCICSLRFLRVAKRSLTQGMIAISIMAATVAHGQAYGDLHDFGGTITGTGTADGQQPDLDVAFDAAGNMYGTACYGGAHNDGMVRELTASGAYIDLHDFGGTITNANGMSGPDGINPYGGPTIDASGNLYGTTTGGGPNRSVAGFNGGVLWEIKRSGAYIDLHDFGGTVINANGTSGPDGADTNAELVIDKSGNIFGTAIYGGANPGSSNFNDGMVWELKASGTYKDLHDFGGTVVNTLGAPVADGTTPWCGIKFDSSGNMFGTTNAGGASQVGIVWELTPSGVCTDLHDFGGAITNTNGESGPDGSQPQAGVVIDGSGNVYGTAYFGGLNGDGIVWEIKHTGAYIDLHDFGGSIENANGESGSDGQDPEEIVFDSSGDMYGTAFTGGGEGWGMVWELTKSGSYLDIHDFGGAIVDANGESGPDGTNPTGGVTFNASGTMFGAASMGGALAVGMVWTIEPIVISLASNSVTGGTKVVGTVTIDAAAPSGGAKVTLSSSDTNAATTPASVLVAAGATSAAFNVTTLPVSASVGVTISASYGGATASAKVNVLRPELKSVQLGLGTCIGGESTEQVKFTLTGPAPSGGSVVQIGSSNAAVASFSAASATISAGSTSVTVPMTTYAVNQNTVVDAKGTLGSSFSPAFTVRTPYASTLTISPSTVTGGGTATGSVTLDGPAGSNGMVVSLQSSTARAQVPPSVTVPAGATSVTFTITTTAPTASITVKIKAAATAGPSASATFTLTP